MISSASDLEKLEMCDLPEEGPIKILPYYNGKNLDFFREYIYPDLQDLIAEPVGRKAIFRHKVLNDNFFGKLTILPSGDVYSNVNCAPVGNIKSSSLKELVFKELTDSKAWLKVRNQETPCSGCLNRDLCPPLSNYEWVIGKPNLCHLASE